MENLEIGEDMSNWNSHIVVGVEASSANHWRQLFVRVT